MVHCEGEWCTSLGHLNTHTSARQQREDPAESHVTSERDVHIVVLETERVFVDLEFRGNVDLRTRDEREIRDQAVHFDDRQRDAPDMTSPPSQKGRFDLHRSPAFR
jgi:hypothetical protein